MTRLSFGRSRPSWLLMVVAIGLAVLCVRLGVWQLDRLGQRRALNRDIVARAEMPELTAADSLARDDFAFRRVRLSGEWDYSREVVVLGRPVNGVPGVFVVTPLQIGDNRAVLVERGWTPSPDARAIQVEALRGPDSALVLGVVTAAQPTGMQIREVWPIRVRGVNPTDLQERFPYALMGIVRRTTVTRPPAGAILQPIPSPQLTNGPHLGYAFQWFGFATVIAAGTIVLLRSERSRRSQTGLDIPDSRY